MALLLCAVEGKTKYKKETEIMDYNRASKNRDMLRDEIYDYVWGESPKKVKTVRDAFSRRVDRRANGHQVPEITDLQRSGSAGRTITPKATRSAYQEMMKARPKKAYGQEVYAPGYEEYENITTFAVNPNLISRMGYIGTVYLGVFGKPPYTIEIDEKNKKKAGEMASNVKRMAYGQKKTVKKMAEQWIKTNGKVVGESVALLTLAALDLVPLEENTKKNNFNFAAGQVNSFFGRVI